MNRVGLLVLAAGASRRMGRPKALLTLPPGEGETFLARILRVARAAGVTDAVVVLGPPHGDQIRAHVQQHVPGPAPVLAWNPTPERGMLSSAQIAAAALPLAISGTLLWPVDLPLVAEMTVRALLAAAAAAPGQLLIPQHTAPGPGPGAGAGVGAEARGGHPIWLPRALLPALQELSPERDQGLRGLRLRFPEKISRIPVDDSGVLRDVDTPTDLEAVLLQAPEAGRSS